MHGKETDNKRMITKLPEDCDLTVRALRISCILECAEYLLQGDNETGFVVLCSEYNTVSAFADFLDDFVAVLDLRVELFVIFALVHFCERAVFCHLMRGFRSGCQTQHFPDAKCEEDGGLVDADMDEQVYRARCALKSFSDEYSRCRLKPQEVAIDHALGALTDKFPYLETVQEDVIPALLDLAKRYAGDHSITTIGDKALRLLYALCECNPLYLNGIDLKSFWQFGNSCLRRVEIAEVKCLMMDIATLLMRKSTRGCGLEFELLMKNLEKTNDTAVVRRIMTQLSCWSELELNGEACEKLWSAINIAIGKSDNLVTAIAKILIDITHQGKMNVPVVLGSSVMEYLARGVEQTQNVLLLYISLLEGCPESREFRFIDPLMLIKIIQTGRDVLRPYALNCLACQAEYQNLLLSQVVPEDGFETMLTLAEGCDFVMKRAITRILADFILQTPYFGVRHSNFERLNRLFLDIVDCSGCDLVFAQTADAIVALFEYLTKVSMDVEVLKPLIEASHEKITTFETPNSRFERFLTFYDRMYQKQ